MWCTSQTSEQVHNLYSFMAHMSGEEQWTNYGGKGVGRAINSKLYALISDDDFRKHSWLDPGLFDYYEYKSCPSGLQGVLRPQLRGVDQIARLARCHQVPSRTGQFIRPIRWVMPSITRSCASRRCT